MCILSVTEEIINFKRGPTTAIVLNHTNMKLHSKHHFLYPPKSKYLTAHLKQERFLFFFRFEHTTKIFHKNKKNVKNKLNIDFPAPTATSK